MRTVEFGQRIALRQQDAARFSLNTSAVAVST